MKEPMKTISFRVPKPIWDLLDAKANEYGISHGICAKILVTETLLGQSALADEFREMKASQHRQERNLKTATVAILVDAGRASPDEATGFVRERFD